MKINIIFLAGALFLTGCNSWLDLKPEDERVSEQYWTSKEDVHTTMLSCYTRLRECMPYFLVWGEIRAENLNVVSLDATKDIEFIHQQDITSENGMVKWDKFYRVINSANSVITYAPKVLEKDPLFTRDEMNSYVAEAKAVRALAYYYLVRAFREVPLVLEPFVSDEYGFSMPKSDEAAIWQQIVSDLRVAVQQAPKSYASSTGSKWQNVSRITGWGAATILAEVYLWTGNYTQSKELCEILMNTGRYQLIDNWYDIFYPGLSDESIFELYFDGANGQNNSLFSWFNPSNTSHYYDMNSDAISEFDADDLRGEGTTFYSKTNTVWKYLGKASTSDATNTRPSDSRSSNWIFYRYADVLLIHAEACAMNAVPDYKTAVASLNGLRARAGIAALDAEENYNQESFLQILLDERRKEFVAEGKRWFDLLRFAKTENFKKYKNLVVNILLKNISLNERPIYQTKLSKEGSFYFPIHKDEIDISGGILLQNEAYQ